MRTAMLIACVLTCRAARGDCRREKEAIGTAISASNRYPGSPPPTMTSEDVERARTMYRSCIERERQAGDPECAATDEDLGNADLARRTRGDQAAYDRAKEADDACWKRRNELRDTPERRSITYSAAICAAQDRARVFRSAGSNALRMAKTIRGKIYGEDHMAVAHGHAVIAMKLKRMATRKKVRILGCANRLVAKIANCISYMNENADCSESPESDYVEDASEALEGRGDDDAQ